VVDGKAANLGEMLNGGLPVTDGLCILTPAHASAAAAAALGPILKEIGHISPGDAHIATSAASARERLERAPSRPLSSMQWRLLMPRSGRMSR
jgi:phosphoenolpyruvate synthase/pyruvate phosphate dikinase